MTSGFPLLPQPPPPPPLIKTHKSKSLHAFRSSVLSSQVQFSDNKATRSPEISREQWRGTFQYFFNVENSIKCEMRKNCFLKKKSIMDIDSNCPYLLFGETTSHLTSKWRGTFQYYFFNVENSIKREMIKNCFLKKNIPPPPPPKFFWHNFFLNVGNSMKREENMKFWKKKNLKFYIFQYYKNS